MTDDGSQPEPATLPSRTAWVFLAAAGALAALGYTATEVLNAGMRPESAGTGVVSPAPSPSPPIHPTPDCGSSGADFTACSMDRMTCEERAAHLSARPQPTADQPRPDVVFCADGAANDNTDSGDDDE
ncbi:hypothetical protein ACFUAG_13550 [Streptomyces sp. NPDC057193]|uniref:hypothetical protein n=1 Tax=unclassified Streptomyces TaxID=2593676 RepID=UPI00093EB8A0|nr:hypothetical protein [Streptomyces sp. CB02261]OKJ61771.1 hypothetical protein AMK29_24750 [Streptomyces sp. CB02261]